MLISTIINNSLFGIVFIGGILTTNSIYSSLYGVKKINEDEGKSQFYSFVVTAKIDNENNNNINTLKAINKDQNLYEDDKKNYYCKLRDNKKTFCFVEQINLNDKEIIDFEKDELLSKRKILNTIEDINKSKYFRILLLAKEHKNTFFRFNTEISLFNTNDKLLKKFNILYGYDNKNKNYLGTTNLLIVKSNKAPMNVDWLIPNKNMFCIFDKQYNPPKFNPKNPCEIFINKDFSLDSKIETYQSDKFKNIYDVADSESKEKSLEDKRKFLAKWLAKDFVFIVNIKRQIDINSLNTKKIMLSAETNNHDVIRLKELGDNYSVIGFAQPQTLNNDNKISDNAILTNYF